MAEIETNSVITRKYGYIKSDKVRVFTLLLIIFQSIGIRFFSGQGSALSAVLILLTIRGVKYVKNRDVKIMLIIFLFLITNKIFNESFQLSALIYQCILVFTTYLFLLRYKSSTEFVIDFYQCLKLIFYNALIGYALFIIANPFFNEVKLSGLKYKTFFYLFYVSSATSGNFSRNTGLLWEPGLLQLALNLFLFYSIKFKKKVLFLLLILLTTLSTFSTAGFIILAVNIVYLIGSRVKNTKNLVVYLVMAFVFIITFFTVLQSNISDKLGGENTSGLIRYRDYQIGLNLIKEKPLIGHGIFENDYLLTKSYVRSIESNLFTDEFLDLSEGLSGGYTNGFLAVFAWFGLPMGIYIYILYFKNRFAGETVFDHVIFFLISGFAFISEPVTYTSFFLLFPLSALIFKYNFSPPQVVVRRSFG
jgi:hypothetical protein